MTISAWVNISSFNGGGQVVSCFDGEGGGFWRSITYGQGSPEEPNDWWVQVGNGSWDTGVPCSTAGSWQQVAVVFSSTDIQFYLNGTLQASYGSPGAWGDGGGGASSTLTVGYDATDSYPQAVDGYLNEVDVWQTALTTTEVAQLYNNGVGLMSDNIGAYPAAPQLVAGYHLTGDTSDFTGHGYDGSLFGDATIDSNAGFQATASTPSTPAITFSTPSSPSDPTSYPQISASYTPTGGTTATAYLDETVVEPSSINIDTPTDLTTYSSQPFNQGDNIQLTAHVNGDGTPTGVVGFYAPNNFYLGSAPLNAAGDDTATATLDTTQIPAGTGETISAVYQGDANFAGTNPNNPATATITVLPLAPPTVTASQSAIVAGQSVSLTATVPGNDQGSLQFYDNGSPLGSALSVQPTGTNTALQVTGSGGPARACRWTPRRASRSATGCGSTAPTAGPAWSPASMAAAAASASALGYMGGGDWYAQVGNGIWDTGVRADASGGWHHVAIVFSPGDVIFYTMAWPTTAGWPRTGAQATRRSASATTPTATAAKPSPAQSTNWTFGTRR